MNLPTQFRGNFKYRTKYQGIKIQGMKLQGIKIQDMNLQNKINIVWKWITLGAYI